MERKIKKKKTPLNGVKFLRVVGAKIPTRGGGGGEYFHLKSNGLFL